MQVRNEATEDFLELLKGWQKLCKRYAINIKEKARPSRTKASKLVTKDVSFSTGAGTAAGEFEVASIVDICYGDPNKRGKRGLKFKVLQKVLLCYDYVLLSFHGCLWYCLIRIREFFFDIVV